MNLREVLDLVVATPKEGWHRVQWATEAAPPMMSFLTGWGSPSGEAHVEVDHHRALAVHREEPSIALAWGLPLDADLNLLEGVTFAAKGIRSMAADISSAVPAISTSPSSR